MNVVVVGAGTMGSGIAYSSAAAGHNVTIVEQDQKLLDAGLKRVQEYIDRAIARGHLAKNQASTLNAKLHGTTDLVRPARPRELWSRRSMRTRGSKSRCSRQSTNTHR